MTIGFELVADSQSSASVREDSESPKTASGIAAKERPWFMAVTLATRPRCFGCGGRMLPKVVVVQADHALCEACSYIDWSGYRPMWRALESLGSPLELTRSRGITFWTPPPTLPDQDAFIRWAELWEIMKSGSEHGVGKEQRSGAAGASTA